MVLMSHFTFEYSLDEAKSKPSIYSATAVTEEEAEAYVKACVKRIYGKEPAYMKLLKKTQF